MPDGFLLLTPILMLGVFALVAFLGFDFGCGFTAATAPPPDPPTNFAAKAGDSEVTLTWTPPPYTIDSYNLKRITEANFTNPYLVSIVSPASAFLDTGLTDGTLYFYQITSVSGGQESAAVDTSATPKRRLFTQANPSAFLPSPGDSAFLTSENFGTIRNDYSGWVGMAIRAGASPISVKALGRIFVSGNNAAHQLKIVDAATGSDLPGSAVTVDFSSGTPANNSIAYASLSGAVTLNANASYYILSQETAGADQFYHDDTVVQTTAVAAVTSAVYGAATPYTLDGGSGQSYGPVDFLY